jgi:FSR family fosmidomycin resistance protein-like MFS transporter
MGSKDQRRWVILIMFMAAHAVNDGFSWVIPPLLPAIREHFQLSYTEMGALYTFFRFSGSILQWPAAYLVHFAPVSTILVGGLLWLSIGMSLSTLSASYGVMVWLSGLSGIGGATYHPLAVSMLSRVFGRDSLGRAIALHLSGSSIGQVIAPFLVGLLLSLFGWRVPIQIWSGLGLLAGMGLFIFLKKEKENFHPVKKAFGLPFLSQSIGIYIFAESLWGIAQMGLMTFLPLFLVDYRGFIPSKAAAVYGIMALSGSIFRPFIGALMDRMGRRKPVIILGFLISALSILGLTSIHIPWATYLFIVLLGTFGSGHAGLADTFMIEMIPSQKREETLGFVYTLRMGIASLSPLIVGFSSERISLSYAFLILAAVPVLSAFFLSFAKEKPVN